MSSDELKRKLEFFYKKYHTPLFLNTDPVQCVHHFSSPRDREIAGLVTSALAYGRAEIIIRNCEWVFGKTGLKIAEFVTETDYSEKKKVFKGFKHRFNDHIDLSALLECISVVLKEYGTIENLFSEPGSCSVKESLNHSTHFLKSREKELLEAERRALSIFFHHRNPEVPAKE
jgi:hypothetical protein